ncbi:hypothetical protein Tco_0609753, partial [Tanacetum coccineum]
MVVSDSDQEEEEEQDVDALIKLAKAAMTVESTKPTSDPSDTAAASSDVDPDVPTTANVPPVTTSFPTDVSAG